MTADLNSESVRCQLQHYSRGRSCWAYIQYAEDAAKGVELFDTSKDPKQNTNLASEPEFAAVVADFQRKLAAKLRAIRDNDLPKTDGKQSLLEPPQSKKDSQLVRVEHCEIESAMRRGLALLEKAGPSWRTHKSCFSCHHQTLVETRMKPVQTYFDNGDPHGKHQFLSTAVTACSANVESFVFVRRFVGAESALTKICLGLRTDISCWSKTVCHCCFSSAVRPCHPQAVSPRRLPADGKAELRIGDGECAKDGLPESFRLRA